jgi:hypothetical protein
MLRGLFVVKQPTVLDGLAFDPFSFQQDGLTAPEVDIGQGEIVDALVIARRLTPEMARHVVRSTESVLQTAIDDDESKG